MSTKNIHSFNRLVKLMARLRAKNGCPWDRVQTHRTLKKYLLEEAYEVCDAIDSKNPEKLKEELGDFLFQVIFHAQISKEAGGFDIKDILDACYDKMVRRHAHVFGKRKAKNAKEAYQRWQEMKKRERSMR
jgi:tetrapyrrole methylase family protein/MazG family protein